MGCDDYEKIARESSLTHAIFFGLMLVLYTRVGCGLNEILRRGFPFFYKIKGFEIRLHVYINTFTFFVQAFLCIMMKAYAKPISQLHQDFVEQRSQLY